MSWSMGAGPVVFSGVAAVLAVRGALAFPGRRDTCLACELAKMSVSERGKLRDSHRWPAGLERGKYRRDVLLFRRRECGLSAAYSLRRRLDSFFVLVHSRNRTVIRLRCHG